MKIKQTPEDFKVDEITELEFLNKGDFVVFKVWKKGVGTPNMISQLANFLDLSVNRVGYAGNKDKQAVTTQFVSLPTDYASKIKFFKSEKIKLDFVGYLNEPISLGLLKGNKFEITVRDLDETVEVKSKTDNPVVNYFDKQRFSDTNAEIGKALVKKDFKLACDLIIKQNLYENSEMMLHLSEQKNEYIGAIKKIPKPNLLLYVHSYQSMLFNKAVNQFMFDYSFFSMKSAVGELRFLEEIDNSQLLELSKIKVPLVGFDFNPEGKWKTIYDRILAEEGITTRDFIIHQLPHLSCEGALRPLVFIPTNVVVSEKQEDELNEGTFKQKVSFELGKGSYATMFIKYLYRGEFE